MSGARAIIEVLAAEMRRAGDRLAPGALAEIGAEAPIGYAGVRLGVVTGLMLPAIESRIAMIDGTG